jgi:hypothetical protein
VTTAAAGAALADSAAAAAASADKVFLLRLPGGRPRRRGTGGVALRVLHLVSTPEWAAALAPARSAEGSGPGSAEGFG